MTTDQASLAERIFLELVADYQTAILNYLYRLVGDMELAEDLTQDTFVKAYGALGRLNLRPEAAPQRRAWLYRIAHNTATDHLRRRSRLRWLRLDEARRQGEEDPIEDIVRREPALQALNALPSEQRDILILFGYVGLAAAEVAAVMGITPETARKRRQRARDAFAAQLARLGGLPPRAGGGSVGDTV